MTLRDSETPASTRAGITGNRMRRLLRHPLAHLVVALTLIALVQAVGVKVYQVPTESMTPALAPGDRILVDRVTTALGTPQRGDLVVFERPADWNDAPPADRPAWRVAAGRMRG